MKPKILFVVPNLNNGGTLTSLKNVLPYLKEKDYDISVFPITCIGPNYDYVAKYANVIGIRIEDDKASSKESLSLKIKRFVIKTGKSIKKKLVLIKVDISGIVFKQVVHRLKKYNFDIVIAFQESQSTRLVSMFDDVKKIAWIRCDYENLINMYKGKPEHKIYGRIDKIVCVSEYTKNVFLRIHPEAKTKTIALYNLIDTDRIINNSLLDQELNKRFDNDTFNIVSVGRIDPVKRFAVIPEIANCLHQRGRKIRWYIIGEKTTDYEYNQVLDRIKRCHMEDVVILLGGKNNPYPYIAKADLLVCTSLSEACPNVINEAKILHTPIVSSDFGSSLEFIQNGENGIVVPVEQMASVINNILTDNVLYNKLKEGVQKFIYDNNKIITIWQKEILC